MKKVLLVIGTIICLCGCTDIRDKSYDDIIASSLNQSYKYVNVYREGYSYYIPAGLKIISNVETSDIITDNIYNYYLYVDRISFHNAVGNSYAGTKNAFYSKTYNYKDKSGYLEINNLQNNKYLIEIMYNYAKIEVIVGEDDINRAISYSIIVLSSIKYNNSIIANLIDAKDTEFKEEEYNIFSTVNNDGNVLQFKENYNNEDENDIIPDTDIIN